jgi:hypothetical protein
VPDRYRPVARVELSDGTGRSAVGPLFTLGNPTLSVSATLNEHIVAGRIAVQRPPCVAGFGVCDTDFNSLFFQFGLNPFVLHAADSSGPWFVDPTHAPNRDQRTSESAVGAFAALRRPFHRCRRRRLAVWSQH